MKKIYITTPIYYVNAAPHIGHAYTTVAADVLNRFYKQQGRDSFLLTGTDEHGSKIEQVAAVRKTDPQTHADEISAEFKELWKDLDIRYDGYVRTTEKRHIELVQKNFAKLLKSGDIYKGKYSGYYCVNDETYWTETEAPDRICPNADCKRPLQLVEEESYFFKLSKYQDKLLAHYKANPGFLMPSQRANEIIRRVEGELRDISVSRTKVKWGIPVPGDEAHTVYVWFDALQNYLTGAPLNAWPADVHIVGKEIYWFHSAIWPAMLMALGLPLPKMVFAHGWWTVEGQKMSKSKGNFIDPRDITKDYGVDALRYFLLREMPFGADGDFSRAALHKRFNAELANDLSNLVYRVADMVDKFLGGRLPGKPAQDGDFFFKKVFDNNEEIVRRMEQLDFNGALGVIWSVVGQLNARVNEQQPWKVAKTDPKGVEIILFDLVTSLRKVGGWLEPFMPETATKIQMQFGVRQFPVPLTPEQVLAGEKSASGPIHKAPPLFMRKP